MSDPDARTTPTGLGLIGLLGAVAVAVYAVRPDLLPGGFRGVDLVLVAAGSLLVRVAPASAVRRLVELPVVVLLLAGAASVAAIVLERGPNRIHDLLGVVGAGTGTLNWMLQAGFEQPGSYGTIVQSFWIIGVVAQLAVAYSVLAAVSRGATRPDRALARGAAVLAILSFAYAATPGVYLPFNGFFSTASRGWEVAVGCLVALASPAFVRIPRPVGILLIGLGGAVFVWSTVNMLPVSATNTSWSALPSVAGTAVLLAGVTVVGGRARSAIRRIDGAVASSIVPLLLTPGLVVGVLAYVFPPIWVPGSNPMRDQVAVVAIVVSSVGAAAAARALVQIVRRLRLGLRPTWARRARVAEAR